MRTPRRRGAAYHAPRIDNRERMVATSNSSNELLPLVDVVQGLREQITQAVAAAQGESVRFQLDSVELELSVVAKREAGGDGKLKFSILGMVDAELGGSGKLATERTQKVKLSLTPVAGGSSASTGSTPAVADKLQIRRKPGQA